MMRAALTALIATMCTVGGLANEPPAQWPWSHTRWGNEAGRVILAEASRQSALVRDILERLDRSDVIVHVTVVSGEAGRASDVRAHLAFSIRAGGVRYLHVTMNTWQVAQWEIIPLLGHELQHALEVAGAPEVRDAATFERFYDRVGWSSGRRSYETDLARQTGRRIEAELRWAKRSLSARE